MSRTSDRALKDLARIYGIQTSYEDVSHKRQAASRETLFLLLRAMDVNMAEVRDAGDALQSELQKLECDGIEPVLVSWAGRMSTIALRLSAKTARRKMRYTLRTEGGDVIAGDVKAEPIARARSAPGAPTHRIRIGGTIPLGYHDLEIETASGVLCSRVIAAPAHARLPDEQRSWGTFMPLYALRGADDWGVGSYSDLEQLARWTRARGGSFVGTLPLLPSFLDVCFEPSPYAPVSRLFWNELFIDVSRAPGSSASAAGTADAAHARNNADPAMVDYRAVGSTRLQALRAAADAYYAAGDTTGVDRFTATNARARDYAQFRAVMERRRESWHQWPDRMRNGEIIESDYAAEDERFHLYVQWVADEQLAAIANASERDAAALYLDLPLGVHADGYDAWRERHLFTNGATAGAPPDVLFTGGQDWGFHPMNPIAQRASGHQYFIECIRHHLHHSRMLRLDHVMSLYRLYWIPSGMDAHAGAYVRYPDDELFAVIALESTRHDASVVGEDLGTVPIEVRRQMEKRHIMRMYVVQYELSPDTEETITSVPRDVVASINTHDMPTLRGYVLGTELKDQLDLGLVDQNAYDESVTTRSALIQRLAHRFGDTTNTRDLLSRILVYLAESPARAVLVNLEDLWLEERPQNVPGTNTERPNWRRRARLSLDEIMNSHDVKNTLALVEQARSEPADTRVIEGQPS